MLGRMMRRAARFLAWTALLVVAVVGAALGVIHTDWGRGVIRDQAMTALTPLFTGEVSLGRIDGSLLDRFSLHDVTLRDGSGQPAVTIAQIAVDSDLWQLWRGVVSVEDLVISEPRILAREQPDGSLNLASLLAPAPESEPSTWIVELSAIEVRDGSLTLSRPGGVVETLDDLQLVASARLAGDDITATLDASGRASGSWSPERRPVRARARLAMTDGVATVDDMRLELGRAWLAISPGRYDLTDGALELATQAHFPADELDQLTGAGIRSDLSLRATVARQDQEQAIVVALTLDTAGGEITAEAEISPGTETGIGPGTESEESPGPRARLEVTTTGLDLSRIAARLPVTGLTLRVAGSAAGSSLPELSGECDVEVAGTVDGERIPDVRARATLADLRSTFAVELVRPTRRGDRLSLEGAARLPSTSSGASSGAWGEIAAEDVVIERAHLLASIGDLQRAAARIPAIDLPALPRASVAVDLRASGSLGAMAVTGRVETRGLRWQQSAVESLSADVDLTGLPWRIAGQARVEAAGIVHAGTPIGDVNATLGATRPGTFDVAISADGPRAVLPLALEGTVVQRGDATTITLGRYRVTTGSITWSGERGTVDIDAARRIQVQGVALASSVGRLAVDGSVATSGRLRGRGVVDARDVELAEIQTLIASLTPPDEPGPLESPDEPGSLESPDEPRAVSGKAALRAEVALSGQAITADIETTVSNLAIDDAPGIELTARLGLKPGRPVARGATLTLNLGARSDGIGAAGFSLVARAPARSLDPDAWLTLDESAVQELTADITGLRLQALKHWIPDLADLAVQGELSATLAVADGARSASGSIAVASALAAPLTAPIEARGELALDDRELVLSVRLDGGDHGVADARAVATLPARLTDGAAWAALNERAITAASLSLSRADVAHWAALAGSPLPFPARADVSLQAGPALESLQMTGQIEAPAAAGVANAPVVTAAVTGMMDRSQITGSMGVTLGSVEFLTIRTGLKAGLDAIRRDGPMVLRQAPADVAVTLTALSVPRTIEWLVAAGVAQPVEAPTGELRGTIQLSGTADDPRLSATLVGDAVGLAGVGFRVLTAGASYARDRLSVDLRIEQEPGQDPGRDAGGWLTMHAETTLPTDPSSSDPASPPASPEGPGPAERTGAAEPSIDVTRLPADGTVKARAFDLSSLAALAPDLGIAGELDADLTITGTAASPRLAGRARIRDGVIQPGPPVRRIHGADLAIDFADTRITLELSARAGRGTLQVSGLADLADAARPALDATVVTDALPLELGTTIAALSTRTRITGQLGDDGWQIATEIARADVALPDREGRELHAMEPPQDVVFVDQRCPEPGGCESPPALPALRLTVRSRDTIRVRGGEVRAVVGCDLAVDTRSGEISIGGAVVVNNGWVELVGRRYRITRAEVSFDATPTPIPDPTLDIALVHEFSSVTIYIQVQGLLSAPELTLRSEPAIYDEAEILAIVAGAEPDSPEDSRTLEDRATGIAAGLIASRVQSLVRDALPVDVIRVELDESLGEGDGAVDAVLVGKWITDDLFLSYGHRFDAGANENTGQVAIEYRIRRRWLLEGSYGDRGVGGMDLLWVKRY